MFIKNKLDPIAHIISILEREDLTPADKILVITLLIEPSIHFEFSIAEYSRSLGISRGTIYNTINKLANLKILKKNRKRHKYIIDCKLL